MTSTYYDLLPIFVVTIMVMYINAFLFLAGLAGLSDGMWCDMIVDLLPWIGVAKSQHP